MTGCPFCAIAAGEADAARVLDEAEHVAFLDKRPVFKGHVLLIPRPHIETLPELPSERVGPLFSWAQRLCVAIQTAMDAQGTFVAVNNVISQSVPHLHVHIVPRNRRDGLRGFFWPRTKYADDAEMEDVAARIRAAMG